MQTLRYSLQIVLGIAIPLSIQLWHRRHLTPAQRACAWNFATWGAALYAFGPLSLLGWFWVTRQRGGPEPRPEPAPEERHRALAAAYAPPLHQDDASSLLGAAARAGGAIVLGIGATGAAAAMIIGIDKLVAAALRLPP